MTIPRVTEVLRCYTGYDHVPRDILDRAAARGTSVHALCAAIAKGEWIPDSMIKDELKGYVESFRKWADKNVMSYILIERRFVHDILGYSGQLDFLIENNKGEVWLVDLKTSANPQDTYPVQMAAYAELLYVHGRPVKGAILVYLNKDGNEPKAPEMEDLEKEKHVFKSALVCWKYFNKGKKSGRKFKHTPENTCSDERPALHTEG